MKSLEQYKFSDLDMRGFPGYLCQQVAPPELKDKNLLDIGCGFGWFEHYASQFAKSIVAIEFKSEDLETAKRNHTNSKISFIQNDALNLTFMNEEFDVVVCWEVLEHINPNMELKLFQNAHRVLKSGGLFYLSTPHNSILSNISDPAWWLKGHRHYSASSIVAYATQAGFKVESVRIVGKMWFILYYLNLYFSKWILRRSPLFYKWFLEQTEKELSSNSGICNLVVKMKKA